MAFRVEECSSLSQLRDLLKEGSSSESLLIVNEAYGTSQDVRQAIARAKGLVTDFDGTLHPGNQWLHFRQVLLPELADQNQSRLEQYLARGEKTDANDIAFIFSSCHSLKHSGLMREALKRCAQNAPPREGALMRSFDGRVQVVSFGIHDYIVEWLSHHDVRAQVAALRFLWEGSNLAGFDPHTVVTDGNKGFMVQLFNAMHDLSQEEVIVLGDAPTDIQMMQPENISMLLIPSKDPQDGRQAFRMSALGDLWPRVRAILASDSLQPLVEMRQA